MPSYSKAILRDAVQQNPLTKAQGILERMFTFWFSGMIYNQIWEDPRVDAKALKMNSSSRILTISSGGCNILNYLIHSPASIDAVDLNPHHMNLTKLKLAAIKHLPDYPSFLQFFGEGKGKENIKNYEQYIAPNLTPEERAYWSEPIQFRLWGPKRRIEYFERGLYGFSRSAFFLRFLKKISALAGCNQAKILGAETMEEQAELYKKYLDPAFDSIAVRTLGKLPPLMFSLGIPPQQFQSLASDHPDGIIAVYRERVRRLACNFSIKENYFAWQSFDTRYNTKSQEALPDYLKEENYETIREGLPRVRTHHCSLTDFLRHRADASLNCFVFLDSQDWMTEEQLTELWSEIDRAGSADARIVFRTAASPSPIETMIPQDLRAKFHYEQERSKELYEEDRAAVYGGFHLYHRADSNHTREAKD